MSSVPPISWIFVATGDIALPTFRHMLSIGLPPLALVTQPDKPAGRKMTMTPPQIKLEAIAAGIPVFQPEKIEAISEELSAIGADYHVVMAYGQILKKVTREIAKKAIINLHASLLPKYRGASCIQAAMVAGDAETGMTVMHVIKELDAGDVICAQAIPIGEHETGGELHDRLASISPELLVRALALLESGTATNLPQDASLSCYAPKLLREHGKLDFSEKAENLARKIRAYEPWPGTFARLGEGENSKRLKIFAPVQVVERDLGPGVLAFEDGQLLLGCAHGALVISQLQPEGSKRMSSEDFWHGHQPTKLH